MKKINATYGEEASTIDKEFYKIEKVSLLFSILSFISFFIYWPGIGTTVAWSPLDVFLLESYSLIYLLAIFFILGFLCEIFPAMLSALLYFDISLMRIRKEKSIQYWVEYIIFALVFLLPLLFMVITQQFMFYNAIKYDMIGYFLMYLAVIKGYNGKYYYGFLPVIVLIFASGSLLCLAIIYRLYVNYMLKSHKSNHKKF